MPKFSVPKIYNINICASNFMAVFVEEGLIIYTQHSFPIGKNTLQGSNMSIVPLMIKYVVLLFLLRGAGDALQIQCYQCEEMKHNDCSTPEYIVNCTVNVQDMCQKEVLVKPDGKGQLTVNLCGWPW